MKFKFLMICFVVLGCTFSDYADTNIDSKNTSETDRKTPKADKANWSINKVKDNKTDNIEEQRKNEFQKLRERFNINQEIQNQKELTKELVVPAEDNEIDTQK